MAKVEIYTSMACPYCTRALHLLKAKRADVEQIDVTQVQPCVTPCAGERMGGPRYHRFSSMATTSVAVTI